jgi:peptidoglycan/xylan/chitin deacetylase (PgdA/CDA1 family)
MAKINDSENMWVKLRFMLRSVFFLGLASKGAILAYHSVDTNGLSSTIDPEDFYKQMQYIKQKGFKVIPLSEMCGLLKDGKPVRRTISIVFYLGYSDFFTYAFPVLKRYNFPVTVFLIPKKLGKEINPAHDMTTLKIMSTGDVKRASAANDLIEFMPYGEDTDESRRAIEKLTGKPADIYAYPDSADTKKIAEHLKKSDAWLGALTLDTGYIQRNTDAFLLPQIDIDSRVTLLDFKKKLS